MWRSGHSWKGHIGIVATVSPNGGHFTAIEGNTNEAGGREGDCVAEKTRRIEWLSRPSGLNLLGFVRPL